MAPSDLAILDGTREDAARLQPLRAAALIGGAALLALGVVVLVGWWIQQPVLQSLHPALASMKANTAIGFAFIGIALLLWHRQPPGPLGTGAARAAAWVVLLIAAATLGEYVLGWRLGLDELIAADPRSVRAGLPPGRMSPATAGIFVLLSAAIVTMERRTVRQRPAVSVILASLAGLSSLIALLGYFYGVRALYAVGPFASVALHTTLGFFVASVAILLSQGHRGLVAVAAGEGPGGTLSRRLVPAALVMPALLGWASLEGQRAGLYGAEFGLALFAVANIVCFTGLVFWSSSAAMRSDRVRRRVEEQVRRSEEDLRITLGSIGDAVLVTDREGRVKRMNAVAEVLTGWSLSEAHGQPLGRVFRIVNERTRETVESPVARVLREGAVVGLENDTLLIARDGTERTIADSGAPVRDDAGQIRGVVLVFRDQTQEHAREMALRESEARKAAVFEAALDCIVTMDHTGNITEFNPAAERTFGYRRDEVVGKPLADFLIPHGLRGKHRAGLERYLATGEAAVIGRRIELPALRADGSEFPVELTVVRVEQDGLPHFTGYIRELSERMHAEALRTKLRAEADTESAARARAEEALLQTQEQLRHSQKMEAVGRLAGGIAHDFNNILSIILGYASMIQSRLSPEDPMGTEVSEILQAGERAADLTRQLLAFSRRQVLTQRVVDLNEVLLGLDGLLRRLIGEDVELTWALGAQGRVKVDMGQVVQVLLNLVVNARDAMPVGGRLTIGTADVQLDRDYAHHHLDVAPGRYVCFSVSDTGTGMDRETQQRIFEPFFTTKEQGRGTGLGLSTVFGIVKQSGGSIWVYSEPGAGSTFKVYLPQTDEEAEGSGADAVVPVPQGGSETILLVEDNQQVRALAGTVLRGQGYTVVEAAGGDEAIALCRDRPGTIDLLLTDVVMPRMSGRQLAEQLAPLRPGMRVLFMSGYTDDAVIRHGVLTSDMEFVQKPLLPGPLLAKVRAVLDPRREGSPKAGGKPAS